jgi:hypothetical protein
MGLPWEDAPGWEYELLRTLPPDRATELYKRAGQRAQSELLKTWTGWVWLVLIPVCTLVTLTFIWFATGFLPVLVRVALEIGFHVTAAKIAAPRWIRAWNARLRPFVWDELLDYADSVTARRIP